MCVLHAAHVRRARNCDPNDPHHPISRLVLKPQSEQQLVSCDIHNGDGDSGCNGGEQIVAMEWIAKMSGICSEAGYPYTSGMTGKTGKCIKGCTEVIKLTAGVELPARNESMLLAALAATPLSLSVDASNDAIWQSYSGGVVTESCKCNQDSCLDHGVTGVGYGVDTKSGEAYYLIKNSWAGMFNTLNAAPARCARNYDPNDP